MSKDQNEILTNKTCTACNGATPPLTPKESSELLSRLGNDWQINTAGHLYKLFKHKNFMQALNFANKIGEIAESEKHHPDLYIAWGKCSVETWTHAIAALTENDFILAAKIQELYDHS